MLAEDILDRAAYITLKRRFDRTNAFEARYAEATEGRGARRFYGFDGAKLPIPEKWQTSPGAFGCCLAHVYAWAATLSDYCFDDDAPFFFMEDDAVFCDGFLRKLEALAPLVPDDFDVLYLGGEHLLGGRRAPERVAEVQVYFRQNDASRDRQATNGSAAEGGFIMSCRSCVKSPSSVGRLNENKALRFKASDQRERLSNQPRGSANPGCNAGALPTNGSENTAASGSSQPRSSALALVRAYNVNRLHAYVATGRALRKIFPRLLAYATNAPQAYGPSGDETCFDYEVGRMTEEGVLTVYAASPFLVGQGGFGSDTYPGKASDTNQVRYWN